VSRAAFSVLAVVVGLGVSGCSTSSTAAKPVPKALEVVSGSSQSGVVGTQLANPLVVKLTDAGGNPVSGQVVNWVVTAGHGSVFAPTTVTDSAGEARQLWTLGTSTQGSQSVEARAVNSATGAPQLFGTFTATALAGPPASIAVSAGNQQHAGLGTALPESLAVLVADQYQNPVPNATVTWTPATNDGAANPPTSTTNASGLATTRWKLGQSFGSNALVATVSGVATGAAFTAMASAGVPASITKIVGDTQTTTGFEPLPVTPSVQVKDAHGNVTPAVTVAFAIASGGGHIDSATATTDTNGIATAGVWTVGIGANSLNATAGNASANFTATGLALSGTAIAVDDAACVLTQTGAPACWGNPNRFATGFLPANFVLSEGAAADSLPELVPGAPLLHSIAAGSATTCGVTPGNAGYCWGGDIPFAICSPLQCICHGTAYCNGARGLVTESPTIVPGGLSLAQIVAGSELLEQDYNGSLDGFACALTTAGAAYCYGQNNTGQLGDGMPTPADTVSTTPVAVTGSHVFATLAAGAAFACGVETGGAVYCWGADDAGQLGDGGAVQQPSPVRVGGGLLAKSVVAGRRHACALAPSGTAYCWGANNGGQLGDGTTTSHSTPVAVSGGFVFSVLAAGRDMTCGITTQGAAYCWGDPNAAGTNITNVLGSVGDGTNQSRAVPTAVSGGLTFSAISTSGYTTCGLTTGNSAVCWGNGQWGMLGNGAVDVHWYTTTPVAVAPLGFTPPLASRVRTLAKAPTIRGAAPGQRRRPMRRP
jgi:hypothetical protein